MSITRLNLIAGEWTAGFGEIENRNPSDPMGVFAKASNEHEMYRAEQFSTYYAAGTLRQIGDMAYRRHARTGCVMVNLATAGTDYHVPFGGRGDSSYGVREQGRYAAEFYTTVKTAYISSGEPA